ncbi:DUF4328 domain-containing protein [Pseudonocardia sp. DSM 110487]|jgi:hypothetical protein|uniref:DUF4328 domain-containing protein n=1 Tax=Pseudonocardia sp. DSM 110487 TaxID=2865833 RepID=UPI001C695D8E|nr:DUF4328 domain-containing protein [Pseudonocardia sp. DSM 110487]QYN35867.1 DUF4328 domain-containing protein [Pseudonocardia sp. DSM 110487]
MGPPCPRCGRQAPAGGGPFCPFCGRYLAALRWVAEPPPGITQPRRVPVRARYTGPPRYRLLPRWGFPLGPWKSPEPEQPHPDPLVGTRSLVGSLVPLLWATAAVALLASGAEVWRYVLLLASRDGALQAEAVAASDALVASAGTVAPILSLVVGVLMVLWTVRAAQAAGDRAQVRPSRSPRMIVLGWLVPGLNLSIPGSVLAEIEHSAIGLPADRRPRPSRLVLVWWGLWAASVVLTVVVLLWSLRTGVQARADGVVLHAVLDLLAAVTAGVTARLVLRITRLLAPAAPRRREVLMRVNPAPA